VSGRIRCLLDVVASLVLFPAILVMLFLILVLDGFERSQVALARRAVRSMVRMFGDSVLGIFLGAPHAADRRARWLAARDELDKIDHD
jgi:hypothetical protein